MKWTNQNLQDVVFDQSKLNDNFTLICRQSLRMFSSQWKSSMRLYSPPPWVDHNIFLQNSTKFCKIQHYSTEFEKIQQYSTLVCRSCQIMFGSTLRGNSLWADYNASDNCKNGLLLQVILKTVCIYAGALSLTTRSMENEKSCF